MLSKNQLGFFYMFISVCAFSLMDVIVKWSEDYPVGQVLFFRGFCGIIPILFLIPKTIIFHVFPFHQRAVFINLGLIGGLIIAAIKKPK